MKNLKQLSWILFIPTLLLMMNSCKKDKKENENDGNGTGKYVYQGKTTEIAYADYREGNGDGAWIYFSSNDYAGNIQIRFKDLGNYVIPTGSFTYKKGGNANPYNPAKNFAGGQVGTGNVYDEVTDGAVTIKKEGEVYTINMEFITEKGSMVGEYKGKLKKI